MSAYCCVSGFEIEFIEVAAGAALPPRTLEIFSDIPILVLHQDGAKHRPTNLPYLGKVVVSERRMRPTGNQRGFLLTTRRKFLADISAVAASAPAIVGVGSLMRNRGIGMSVRKNYYGFCDRLSIKCRYENGKLRGRALMQMIEQRILQVPPAILAYDLARWGTGGLSLVAREERREALWPSVKRTALP